MAIPKTFDVEKQFDEIKKSAMTSIENSFPIEGKRQTLVLDKVWVEDNIDPGDLTSQKDAKLNGQSWAVPVYATISLIENGTGSIINQARKMKLIDLPKLTPRASYIVGGNEYQVVNQLRLKPGVYTRIKNNGELESKVNLAKGANFDILLNQERGVFILKIETSNVKLYPILKDLGVSDDEMRMAWGEDLLESNRKASAGVMDTEIKKLRMALIKKPTEGRASAIKEVKDYLDSTLIDPDTTKKTMGEAFTKADVSLLLATSKRLLETATGEKPADDRDSLVFKNLHSVDDFIKERLALNENKVRQAILRRVDSKSKVSEILNRKLFDDPVKTMFTSTSISSPSEQTNPLHMYSGQLKLTIMGEGGIQNEQAVTDGARSVHPSEIGFVDPVITPQSGQVGAVTRLALGIKKDGNRILTAVKDPSTGEVKHVDPIEFGDLMIAHADQYTTTPDGKLKPIASKVKALGPDNKPVIVPASKIDYVINDPKTMFSVSSNLIPFLNSTQGNRALMASGQYEQALGLKNREQPLVQVDTGLGTTAEQDIGEALSHGAPVDGVVDKIEQDAVIIKDSSGKKHKVGIYDDFPLNQKTFINSVVKVKEGEAVKKGQLLADNNYTVDGVLSMGTNLKVAYMPYKGYNFEDGIVISESASKKLTSEHMHKKSVSIADGGLVDKKKFMAYFPSVINAVQAAKLDDDGVIMEGQDVEYGDILIAYMTRNAQTPERALMQKLHRSLLRPYSDKHESWKYEFKGKVSKVVKSPKEIFVYIKTEEPAIIGDKLSGRYGNKGIISTILPDKEMPHTLDGDPLEIILNPIGIPSRLNPSQILETAAAKAAKKSGEVFKVRNFNNESNFDQVQKYLKKHGVKDKEVLIDPEDGKPLGAPVMVGMQFTTKLDHPVRKKYSARSRGAYTQSDHQPATVSGESGQSMDQLTLYSMLAHGSKELLRESATYKAEQNDEFWRSLQLGHPLPAPKPSFAYEKFVDMLKASGVNVTKDGSKISLSPLTDKDVKEMSSGEIENSLMLKGKNLAPESGGLFDKILTGGPDGSNWTHFNLSESIPNPMFENAIKTLTGLKQNIFDDIIAGKKFVTDSGEVVEDAAKGKSGGAGIQILLSKVEPGKRLEELNIIAKSAKPAQLDKLNKEIRYLQALEKNNMKPTDYIMNVVPVIPPKFRPIYPMEDGSLMTSDPNMLYRDAHLVNQKLDELKNAPDAEKTDLKRDLYKSVKAIQGLGNPITFKDYRGFVETIKGKTQPKSGFFQKKLIKRRQDLSGRSTIVPEPLLGVDEVGLPKDMAWKIYEPHVVRELVQRGYTPLDALKNVKDQSPIAERALEAATDKRPVFLNRSPSLHKFSIMSFKPQLTTGKTIKIHPIVVSGFGADFDGDSQIGMVIAFFKKSTCNLIRDRLGYSYMEDRIMTSRFRESLPYIDEEGEVVVVDLQDFPRSELIRSKIGKNGIINFYKAMDGVKVIAYDESSRKMVWADVFGWSEHIDREIEIVNLKSKRQIITDDDPRAVYGMQSGKLSYQRYTPTEALENSVLVPRNINLSDAGGDLRVISLNHIKKIEGNGKNKLLDRLPLTDLTGYFFGSGAGDGWATRSNWNPTYINIASDQKAISEKFVLGAKECVENGSELHSNTTARDGDGTKSGGYGYTEKTVITNKSISVLFDAMLGHGADKKHLPPFFLTANKEFRLGMFAGLIDTDGTISISNAKKKPQLMCSYATNSLRLANEVRLLASSIGIKGRITTSKTSAGKDCWVVSFSNSDVQEWGGKYMVHPDKLAKLHSVEPIEMSPNLARQDIVPISFELAKHARDLHGAPRGSSKEHKSIYYALCDACENGYITRHSAKKVLGIKDLFLHEDYLTWRGIVENEDVTWDQVVSVEKTGIKETGYDLTVPGFETFMNTEGIILSNTMSVHVPVTEKGRVESYKMLPTNNIFNPATGEIMLAPMNEMILGLYLLTKAGTKIDKKYSDLASAKKGLDNEEITINSIITIGSQETTLGRAIVNSILPSSIQDPNIFLDKKGVKVLLEKVAKEAKPEFGKIVDALKDLGNQHAFKTGFTVGLEDIAPQPQVREKVQLMVDNALAGMPKGDTSKVKAYSAAGKVFDEEMMKALEQQDTSLYHMARSGAKGSLGQLRQITTAPNLVQDHEGNVIPEPILRSYSEGLDNAGYWNSMYGARAGTIGKSLQSQIPGFFTKRLVSSVLGATVGIDNCGTNKGIEESVDKKDIIGRNLAFGNPEALGKKDDDIDAALIAKAKALKLNKILIRSPLTCEATSGVCKECFGKTAEGEKLEVGDNIGAIAATAMSEPLLNMSMKAFHTGGVAGEGGGIAAVAQGYDRIAQLLELPDIVKGKATLSEVDGKVTRIDKNPAGGHFVYVGTEKHFVPQTRLVSVKVGDSVKKGDYLSDGVAKPQELLELKGVDATRNYMTDELQKAYNVPIKRNMFEAVVKEITNTTKVLDPGSNNDYTYGDYAPLSKIEDLNNSGGDIVHQPILKGINTLPLVSEDWMARLGTRDLAKTIREGAARNWSSDIHGTHPIPAYVYGAEFGMGTEGKY